MHDVHSTAVPLLALAVMHRTRHCGHDLVCGQLAAAVSSPLTRRNARQSAPRITRLEPLFNVDRLDRRRRPRRPRLDAVDAALLDALAQLAIEQVLAAQVDRPRVEVLALPRLAGDLTRDRNAEPARDDRLDAILIGKAPEFR